MRRSFLPSACLAAGALLCLAASAPAAPAPTSSDLDKYLPDDAVFVGVVKVKQITAWVPFQKQLQAPLQQLLKMDVPQQVLKGTDFDPLRDLESVAIAACVSSCPESVTGSGRCREGPTFLLAHGRFAPEKIAAKLEQLAEERPDLIASQKVGDLDLWTIGSTYFAVLDKETIMASDVESQAMEAAEKAGGKKKTRLKDKRMQNLLAGSDPKLAVEWFACGDMLLSEVYTGDGQGYLVAKRTFLRDEGIEVMRGGVALDDSGLRVEMTFRAVDADKAKAMMKDLKGEIAEYARQVRDQPDNFTHTAPLMVDAMEACKIVAAGDLVTLKGSVTPEVIASFLRQAGPSPNLPPPPNKDK